MQRTKSDNANTDVQSNFKVDVEAYLQGLVSTGHFEAEVEKTDQYKTFQQSAHNDFWCRGGNLTACTLIRHSLLTNGSYDYLLEWQKSAQTYPDLSSVSVVSLWSLFRTADSQILRDYEISISNAFSYLAQHPLTHYTICSIVISAPWAEIGMITPGADIVDVKPIDVDVGIITSSLDRLSFRTKNGAGARDVRIQ